MGWMKTIYTMGKKTDYRMCRICGAYMTEPNCWQRCQKKEDYERDNAVRSIRRLCGNRD